MRVLPFSAPFLRCVDGSVWLDVCQLRISDRSQPWNSHRHIRRAHDMGQCDLTLAERRGSFRLWLRKKRVLTENPREKKRDVAKRGRLAFCRRRRFWFHGSVRRQSPRRILFLSQDHLMANTTFPTLPGLRSRQSQYHAPPTTQFHRWTASLR